MLRWLAQFRQFYPNIDISAPVNGSGIAGPCLTAGYCNMSIITREILLSEEIPFINKWKYKPFEVPITGGSYAALAYTDGLVIMVHPSNPLSRLTLAQVDAIFSTTRHRGYLSDISTWDQLGLTGDLYQGKPIHVIGVQIPNGFELFLNRTILLEGSWKSTIITRPTVFELATLVSLDPLAIGYTGLAFLNATVKLLALAPNGGWPYSDHDDMRYFLPLKNDICRRDYPLSRLIYLYLNKAPGEKLDPVILEFLSYILSLEGQTAVQDDMIFLPLPVSTVLNMRAQLGLYDENYEI
jgi:phosphate transport system substrate-binding protein